ncbi:hypothetical protein CHS0354_040160 [Potamilus streckersoni]|uniref:Protein kinase domain-containing protein n=1 Tax=Potamilus streckersoni TaxID=2493646 RepID=A0AAE0W1X5_9BIVA|nr:hypothetical protein CHS0354_040160 [Potamilus streckersoni]
MVLRRGMKHSSLVGTWHYCVAFVTLVLMANVLILHRKFSSYENENFIGAGGTSRHFRPDNYGERNHGFLHFQLFKSNLENYSVFESRLRKLMEIMDNTLDNSVSHGSTERFLSVDRYFRGQHLDCDGIENITNKTYIASGWTKAVYKGIYKEMPVALKTVDPQGQDVSTCMEKSSSSIECYANAAKKIVKEVVILQALNSENVLKVLGFCLPRSADDSLWVAMVTELGESVDLIKLLQMSWEDRLRVSHDITKIAYYLSTSPYGSISMNDFRRQQFVLVDGRLKLSDVDDVGFEDPVCVQDPDCELHFSSSNFTQKLKCLNGRCSEFNEKKNLFNAGRHFTTFLLPHGAPLLLQPMIDRVIDGYSNLTMNSKELLSLMDKIVNLYKSGWYLNRTKPDDYQTEYKKVEKSDLPGQYDYRCRFSLSGSGCTVSVFDQKEAEEVCDLDPECKGFVISSQKSWTGRIFVHLKSGIGEPSYDPSTTLFIRPSRDTFARDV